MKQFLLILVSLFYNCTIAVSQCNNTVSAGCGQITAQGGVCGTNIVFCISDSVGFRNLTSSSLGIDSSYICWGDGTIDSFAGVNPVNCFKHKYTYREDSCVGGNGTIQQQIGLSIIKKCPPNRSNHWISTSLLLKFKPKASFSTSDDTACVYSPILFDNTSCPNDLLPTYVWNWGDGSPNLTTTSDANQTHTYTSPGTYTVTLTVSQGQAPTCGISTITRSVFILPGTSIIPSLTITDTCAPATFTGIAFGSNVTAYTWSISSTNASIPATVSNPNGSPAVFTTTSPGTYNVTLAATGCCSAPTSACTNVSVVRINGGFTTDTTRIPDVCAGLPYSFNPSVYFSVTGGSVTAYNWQFQGGTPATFSGLNPGSVSFNTPGIHAITLIVTGPCGRDTLRNSVNILSPATINPSLAITDTCAPAIFTGFANAQNATSYSWSITSTNASIPGTVTNANSAQPIFNVSTGGTYTVSLTVGGCCLPAASCTWSRQVAISSGPLTDTTKIPDVCAALPYSFNPSTYFSVTGGTVTGYDWQFQGGTPATFSGQNPGSVSFNTPGIHTITLVLTTPCGTDTLRNSINVNIPVLLNPSINLPGLFVPVTLTASANGQNATAYYWATSPPTSIINPQNSAQTSITITTPGTYTIALSAQGCCSAPTSSCFWDTTITFYGSVSVPDGLTDLIPTLTVFPNPSSGSFTVKFTNTQKQFLALELLDLSGKVLCKIVESSFDPGEHSFRAEIKDCLDFKTGTYTLRLRSRNGELTKKIVFSD